MTKSKLKLTSPAFADNGLMPKKYSGYGEEISPPLLVDILPKATQSLVVKMVDLSVPFFKLTHWIIWDLPPINFIEENTALGVTGRNSIGKIGYMGPKPPFSSHKYLFRIYALDIILGLDADNTQKTVFKAMANHILAQGELTGLYHKCP